VGVLSLIFPKVVLMIGVAVSIVLPTRRLLPCYQSNQAMFSSLLGMTEFTLRLALPISFVIFSFVAWAEWQQRTRLSLQIVPDCSGVVHAAKRYGVGALGSGLLGFVLYQTIRKLHLRQAPQSFLASIAGIIFAISIVVLLLAVIVILAVRWTERSCGRR